MTGYAKRLTRALFAIAMTSMVFASSPALGADIIVDTLSEDVLKNAIVSATSADVVRITAEGVITLTGQITISKEVKIVGPGQNKLSISGNNAYRVFSVASNVSADISELSIVSGVVSGNGGGMYNLSNKLTVTNCTFSGNRASYGGGMYNAYCSPIVSNCTFNGNSADSAGGMFNWQANSRVTNCTFSGNTATSGGGMVNHYASPIVTGCTFSGNSSTDNGGGMANGHSGPIVTNCTFSGNSDVNNGGGMYNYFSNPTVTNCTFSGNSARYGSGLYNWDTSSPLVVNCIFWDLNGEEISNVSSSATVRNSIVKNGSVGAGTISSDIATTDPLLGVLEDNGGPTRTCAIPVNSPAVDAGTSGGAPETDQRGVARPQGDGVDIGAYEFAVSIPPILLSPENGATGMSLTSTLETEEFSHPAGLAQAATQWQVGTDETFGSGIVVDETSDTALTAFTLSDGILENGTTYYWRVRFQDSGGNWSGWSDTWNFTTSSAGGGGGGGCQAGALPGLLALFLPLIFFRFNGKIVR